MISISDRIQGGHEETCALADHIVAGRSSFPALSGFVAKTAPGDTP